MRHVVTRTVRDSATALDLLHGYMPGDPLTAPSPARPYASEVGTDPGKLRIGVCTTVPAGLAETDPVCAAAATDAAKLLESLGHTVEESAPAALGEADLMPNFSTVLTSWVRADLAELERIAGRPITADDVEPMTWLYHQMGAAFDGGAFVVSLNALQRWTRRVVSWWLADGFDLLLTPTLAEPPPLLGDIGGQDDGGGNSAARSIPFAAYPAPFNVTGQPAMSVPLYWSDTEESRRSTPAPAGRSEANPTIDTEESRRSTPAPAGRSEANPTTDAALPIGVQLVAAPFREDVLFRVAAQLEAARPWAGRRPPVHA
jgi:amidase